MTTLAIIDYGMGNLNSVAKALVHVAPNATVKIVASASEIKAADRVILPGQAAMPDTMRALRDSGLLEATITAVKTKPMMGMCLGLQMLFDHSDEGNTPCLGVFRGNVVRFPNPHSDEAGNPLKVPHMGWNAVTFGSTLPAAQNRHVLWQNIAENSAFYFANSYFCVPENAAAVAGTANYPNPFCVAYAQDNVFAVQFHPEKSSHAGLQLLKNFIDWNI
jgi:imidazole glycerol-phosphate synthase subunit HisH